MSATPSRTAAKAPERAAVARSAPASQAPALTALAGNQAMQALLRGGWLRPKLELGAPDDPEEREADTVADRVMRMPEGACCGSCAGGGTCEDEKVHRKPETSAPARETIPRGLEHQVRRLTTGGEMLASSLRAFFEPRMGRDLSAVRVHRDGEAQSAAASIQAKAFTVGEHVAVGAGHWSPETGAGRRLLAHELAHTVQQGAAATRESGVTPATPSAGGASAGLAQRPYYGTGNVLRATPVVVRRSWIGDRIGWVQAALRSKGGPNWDGSEPPGAYYILNGLSLDDMVGVLRKLEPTDRKTLSANLDAHAAAFDRSRLQLALANAAAPAGDKAFLDLSENLHWAIRSGNYSKSPDGAFFLLAAVDKSQRKRVLEALYPATHKILFDHLSEASIVPGGDDIPADFERPDYSVTATTKVGPTYGHCGDVRWSVQWGTQPVMKDGYIIQEIRRITRDKEGSTGTKYPNKDVTFWEAWRVVGGSIEGGGDDTWANAPQPRTKGKWEIIGRTFAIAGPLDPQANFQHSAVDQAPFMMATKIRPGNLGPSTLNRRLDGEYDCTDTKSESDGFIFHRPLSPSSGKL